MNKLQEYIIVSISFLITITTFSTHYVYVPTFKTILTLSSSIMIDKGDTAAFLRQTSTICIFPTFSAFETTRFINLPLISKFLFNTFYTFFFHIITLSPQHLTCLTPCLTIFIDISIAAAFLWKFTIRIHTAICTRIMTTFFTLPLFSIQICPIHRIAYRTELISILIVETFNVTTNYNFNMRYLYFTGMLSIDLFFTYTCKDIMILMIYQSHDETKAY